MILQVQCPCVLFILLILEIWHCVCLTYSTDCTTWLKKEQHSRMNSLSKTSATGWLHSCFPHADLHAQSFCYHVPLSFFVHVHTGCRFFPHKVEIWSSLAWQLSSKAFWSYLSVVPYYYESVVEYCVSALLYTAEFYEWSVQLYSPLLWFIL